MGLQKCKECGNQVSDKAEKCPVCGAPVKKPVSAGKVILGVIAILVLAGVFSNPSKNTNTTTTSGKSPSMPMISIDSDTLFAEHEANEVRADEQYKGRQLQVIGYIDNIGKNIVDDMYVTLKTKKQIFSVQCFFDKSQTNTLASLRKGSFVTIAGRCNGKFGNVLLKDCVLR